MSQFSPRKEWAGPKTTTNSDSFKYFDPATASNR